MWRIIVIVCHIARLSPQFQAFQALPIEVQTLPIGRPVSWHQVPMSRQRAVVSSMGGNDVDLQKTGWKRLKIDANGHQILSNPEIFSRADDGSKKSFEHSEKNSFCTENKRLSIWLSKKLERLPPHFFGSLWDPNGFHGFHGFEQDLAPCEPCGESREPGKSFAQWKSPATRLLVTGSISIHLSLGLQP